MKYLDINSKFISREFSSMMSRALDEIKHFTRKSSDKGSLDCAMSKFGQSFDSLVTDYFIDHIRFCRKYGHFDENTLSILRVLNTYKKVGVHEMFKKLYPKYFEVRKLPIPQKSRPISDSSSFEYLKRLNDATRGRSGSALIKAVSNLLSEFECNNTQEYIDKYNIINTINNNGTVGSLFKDMASKNSALDAILGPKGYCIYNENEQFPRPPHLDNFEQYFELPGIRLSSATVASTTTSSIGSVGTYFTIGSTPPPDISEQKNPVNEIKELADSIKKERKANPIIPKQRLKW